MSFGNVLTMEWIKLRSLRSTTWVLAVGMLLTAALGVVAGFNTRSVTGDPTNNMLAGLLIGQVITGFDSAYNSHDMGRIQSVWTGLKPGQAKDLAGFFKSNPEARLSDSCSPFSLTVSGETASWTCNETSTYNDGGKQKSQARSMHFTFVHKNGTWTIEARQ